MFAAPHSSFETTIENFTINLLEIENRNDDRLEGLIEKYRCHWDVIGKAVSESGLKADYDRLNKAMNILFNVSLSKCRGLDDASEKRSYVHNNINFFLQ